MLSQYLLVAWRNILKHQLHSILNIIGLGVGLAACFIIAIYVNFELSYDKHHPQSENLYRIALNRVYPQNEVNWAIIPVPVAPTITEVLPEVENYTHVTMEDLPFGRSGTKLRDQEITTVDSGFFDIFHAPVIKGSLTNDFFKRKDGVILTQRAAKKYFDSENPIGQSMSFKIEEGTKELIVEAVIEDPLPSMHFSYEVITSVESLSIPPFIAENWGYWGFLSYIKVYPDVDISTLEEKITKISEEHQSEGNNDYNDWLDAGNRYNYFLQPVPSIHLESNLMAEYEANSSKDLVYFFALIAVLILVIAIVNFVNLATAKASHRTLEVGIRKAVGAQRQELVIQFLMESTLISFIAMAVALPITQITLPFVEAITGKALSLSIMVSPLGILVVIGLPIILGLLSGFYPALYLSHFRPAVVFQKNAVRRGRYSFRRLLVIGQFVIAVLLIAGTATVYRQVHFLSNTSLGFDKNQLISIDRISLPEEKIESFAQQARELPGVEGVAISSYPIDAIHEGNVLRHPDQPEGWINATMQNVDEQYIPTMGMQLIAGRNFLATEVNQKNEGPENVILNATTVKALGWYPNEAVGQTIVQEGANKTIIGVVEDFNYEPLHNEVAPLELRCTYYERPVRAANIRISANRTPEALAGLENLWNDYAKDKIFAFEYIDEVMAEDYDDERLTGKLFIAFSGLAILICCLGLFGLMAFMAERRAKEVGVRKVMGARMSQIIMLLSTDFMRLVLISSIIAIPIAWYGLDQWLEGFAYRVENSFWILMLSGAIATIISMVTVVYYAYRSASVNPTNLLKED
ncbi:FtsX-like permease family protein [Fulvivirga sp.]|uniref:ABC transporter permease n=1 Tax=Fulvivirga sp. TaxID=1931237 RepID=UPI0032EF41ED